MRKILVSTAVALAMFVIATLAFAARAAAAPAAEPFGTGCASLPTDPTDPGSPESMAREPVATAASANPDLSTLVKAIALANLRDSLNTAREVTVFAPTNAAFQKLNPEDLASILSDDTTLRQILTYHVVPQTLAPDQLAGTHTTQEGSELTVTGSGHNYTVNDTATVVCGNIQTANGTVYLIDTVLQPVS